MVQLQGRVGGKGEFIEQKHLPQRYFVEICGLLFESDTSSLEGMTKG